MLSDVKTKLSKFEPVIATTILSSYSNKSYTPSNNHRSEIDEAIRRNFIDDEGDVNYKNRHVSELLKSIEDLQDFLRGDTTDSFDEHFEKEYDISPYDSDTQDFWEQVYELEVPKY